MTKSDKQRFLEGLLCLAEMRNKKLSTGVQLMYFEALKSYLIEEVEKAISQSVVTQKWFPQPVELIELMGGATGTIEDTATVEATKVLKAVRSVGSYESVKFDDPTTQAVIMQGFGGWVQMCRELTVDQEKWWVKDFVKLYQSFKRSRLEHHEPLLGIADTHNTAHGLDSFKGEPVLIDSDVKKLLEDIG